MTARLLTTAETAALLRVSRWTPVRLAKEGKIPGAVRVGHGWRFDRDVLERWLEERKTSGERHA